MGMSLLGLQHSVNLNLEYFYLIGVIFITERNGSNVLCVIVVRFPFVYGIQRKAEKIDISRCIEMT